VDELRATLSRGEAREHELGRDLAEAQKHRTVAETQVGELRRGLDEQKAILASAEKKLGDTFRALAAEALAANNEGFLTWPARSWGPPPRDGRVAGVATQGHRGAAETGARFLWRRWTATSVRSRRSEARPTAG